MDFGAGTESVEFRAASVTGGGDIEIRLDKADGELLGTCDVADTGDWQKWADVHREDQADQRREEPLPRVPCRARSDDRQHHDLGAVPRRESQRATVEINVRQTVFTPEKTGINYITVRGFTLRNAATPWAPPTAGQIGLVSAYWCKGWIIENNDISYSKCSGVALGKYGDEWDNTSAEHRRRLRRHAVRRALKNGWNKETVGSHIVRNNHISSLRADRHRRQPRLLVQHRHRQRHPRHPRPAAVRRRGNGRHQVPRRD